MTNEHGSAFEEIAQRINELDEAQKVRFIAALAKSRGLDYTIDGTKRGEGIYYDDRHRPIYPPNNGAKGGWKDTILRGSSVVEEQVEVDRYGGASGNFLSPAGTPFEKRALPSEMNDKDYYHKYRVLKSFVVKKSISAPWFDQPGEGIQYMTDKPVKELVEKGYLEEVYD